MPPGWETFRYTLSKEQRDEVAALAGGQGHSGPIGIRKQQVSNPKGWNPSKDSGSRNGKTDKLPDET